MLRGSCRYTSRVTTPDVPYSFQPQPTLPSPTCHGHPSNMATLPDDVVYAIATQLKGVSSSNADLFAFLLVCQQWYQLGVRILYRNLALTDFILERFIDSFVASTHGQYVRSLSMRFDLDYENQEAEVHVPNRFSKFRRLLERMAPLVSEFQTLASFSLYMEGEFERWIPRRIIVSLQEALPQTCSNLELDMPPDGVLSFAYNKHNRESVHLCDAVRHLLPRMRHVRIRLPKTCSAMFGTDCTDDSEAGAGDNFAAIALPKLKSLVVNCGFSMRLEIQQCNHVNGHKHLLPLTPTPTTLSSNHPT